ncbi:hypothetical protein B6V73_16500 [Thioclava sp. JM3]|uniref:asparagine synthase-related protein n=1 Tax=Thioclava sp. JM3 TaxID=1973004 RepID=UPI000B5421BE|nr:asparagine synthase-related protein [Thioclava sp. JM3]OWY14198.1 hypothetical protein B6V73_16500 [Thioclava sp. JM3]
MIALLTRWGDQSALRQLAPRLSAALSEGGKAGEASIQHNAVVAHGTAFGEQSLAHLPSGDVLLFCGAIDNAPRMRAELGCPAASGADLYAAARLRWGEDAEAHVAGAYAAILLQDGGKRIRLVRSPIRAPALYYWSDAESLIVASTPGAIFATGLVERRVDQQKLADSLYLNYAEEERGWFEGVIRLPRGARAEATPEGVTVSHYYDIGDIPPVRFNHDQDYVDAADALFAESVEQMLDGFDRPAISLSGGFDSQAVAAYTMRARRGQALMSYTSVPRDDWQESDAAATFGDERAHVTALAAMYPELLPRWITGGDRELSYCQRELFETALVAPRNGANLYWIHDIRKAAKADGADVLLTGALGNLTFSYDGTGLLPDLLRQRRIGRAGSELWHGGSRRKLAHRVVAQAVLPFLSPAQQRAVLRKRGAVFDDPLDSWSPIHPEFAADMKVAERSIGSGVDRFGLAIRSVESFRRTLMGNAATEGGDMMYAMDRLHGLPSRDPTAYRPLLEYCFGIPATQYRKRGVTRWLARRMLAGKVPEMILKETRRGRQAADWFIRLKGRRDAIIDELDWLTHDPDVSGRLDLQRLRRAVETMPESQAELTPAHAATLSFALSRGLTTARFIRFLAGRNDI